MTLFKCSFFPKTLCDDAPARRHSSNEILSFAMGWMELESIMLSEISQRQIPYDFTHMWNLRNDKKTSKGDKKRERQTKKQTLNYRAQIDGYQRGGREGDRLNR